MVPADLPFRCPGAHPYYLAVHSCVSCTSAVCIVALLVATINSSMAETRILPAFVSASVQKVGLEKKAKELFTQLLCSPSLCVCPGGSASA